MPYGQFHVKKDGSTLTTHLSVWSTAANSPDTVRLDHEVTHFTVPVPDREDRYGRPQYLTYHRFVSLETITRLPTLVAESVQYSSYRDRPPPPTTIALRSFLAKSRRAGAQIFTRHFLCDDPTFDLESRWELTPRHRD